MRRAVRFCLMALALLLPRAAAADALQNLAAPLFGHLGAADGLPFPIVLTIAQDRAGYLWLGTPSGLVRWNGYAARIFRHEPDEAGSLPESLVLDLQADPDGSLWVGTISGRVSRYEPATERFAVYSLPDAGTGRPLAMAPDGSGGLYVGGDHGLFHIDRADPVARRLGREPVRALLRDGAGTLWVGGVGPLALGRLAADGTVVPVPLPAGGGRAVTALAADGARVLYGTATGALGEIRSDAPARELAAATGRRVTAIVVPVPDRLWVASTGGGIAVRDAAGRPLAQYNHAPSNPASLADDFVADLLVDRSGLVWVAHQAGADRVDPADRGIATLFTGSDALPGQQVRGLVLGADGRLWLGYRRGGVQWLDPATGRSRTYGPADPATGRPSEFLQALAPLPDGSVLAGARFDVGVARIDPQAPVSRRVETLADRPAYVLARDGDNLWAGGSWGLARLEAGRPEAGVRQFWRHDAAEPGSLSSGVVQAVLRDGRGRLWVASAGGLNRLDEATGQFRHVQHDPGDPASLPSDVAGALAEDRAGRLWVGTEGGIGVLVSGDGEPARFRRVTQAEGLPSDGVRMLLSDRTGRIWASTDAGLAVIDPDSFAVRALREADGDGIRTFLAGSGTALADGTLLFGGVGGMVRVTPDKVVPWDFRPPVVADRVTVGGRPVPAGAPVTVGPEDRGFAVEFAALDFSAPGRNRYAYRLAGFDDDWIETDASRRVAAYTSLPPGRYQLQIRGSNRDGAWTEAALSLPIRVLPAWHQTTWFRSALVAAGLMAVLLLVQWRSFYLRQRAVALEREVAARTEEAHQAREAAEAADRDKSRLLAVVGHEIRTPLNGVMGVLQLLGAERLTARQRHYLEVAETSGEVLLSLLDGILDYGRLEAQGETLELRDFDLARLVTGTVELMRPQADAKDLDVELLLPAGPDRVLRSDPARLSRVLLNLIGNAVKFTPAGGSVRVSAELQDGGAGQQRLRVAVTDDGIGIAPDMQEAIFREFVQADDAIARRFGGTGLGLSVCRRIATMMGGTLTVDSAPGRGSTFVLDVPVEAGTAPVPAAAPALSGPLSVLVVDDDEVNRMVAAGLLQRLGHRVAGVESGVAALALLSASAPDRPDVILLDLHMPELDGFETARRLRALPAAAAVRIIAVTADLTAASRARCAEAGMAVLGKPLQLRQLRQALSGLATAAPAEAPAPAAAPLDLDYLYEQWDALGTAALVQLGRVFHRGSRRVLAAMEAAAAAGDRSGLRETAHHLRGMAGTLGMVELRAAAAAVEQAAQDEAADPAPRVAALAPLRTVSLRAFATAVRAFRDEAAA